VEVLGDEMKRQIPKTHQALELIGKGMSAAQAARKMEISESSVYAALRKTKAKDMGCCPTCGHKIRN
jgi:transposase